MTESFEMSDGGKDVSIEAMPERLFRTTPAALGLGLCDTDKIFTPEQRQALSKDLHILHIMRAGIRSTDKQELIN